MNTNVIKGEKMNTIVLINEKECVGCGACVEISPNKILYLKNDKCTVKDETKCDKSKGCESVCPTGAITIH